LNRLHGQKKQKESYALTSMVTLHFTMLGGGGAGWQAVSIDGLIPLHVDANERVSPHCDALDPSL
jgi:hypothetical protein